ncbi:TapB family protein [Algibacter mikhailovii]|uniref:DUF3108 domain-containing protein n=1 Tax=Algibacter mikhailovii TaxID=425498 RepID=A0A918VDP0_9FLAO|nr:hypothetical protein [Algibacter mikhailovii]GGZ91408.1 hypothetical protein GCM10007028_32190 [Algibacter mikhailovii]
MKTKYIVVLLAFHICLPLVAQDTCNAYYPFEEGAQFEITNFNKKGKKEGHVSYKVTNIDNHVATLETQIFDAKGKEITTTEYDVTCEGNSISIDFKSLMSPELFKQYKDMDVDMTGTNIEFPKDLEIGQTLNDANMNMAINMSGMKMTMTINMVDRKVDTKESITTPAGTFDCYILSYTSEMKMGMTHTFSIKEWVSEGIGMVKNETYNKKGNLISYSELTKFSK